MLKMFPLHMEETTSTELHVTCELELCTLPEGIQNIQTALSNFSF